MRKPPSSREIFDKGSQLAQLVRIAGDLQTDEVDLKGLDILIIGRIIGDCNYYVQSSDKSLLCASGKANGQPFVREACNRCIIGQFSERGVFVGEIILSTDELSQSRLEDDSNIF